MARQVAAGDAPLTGNREAVITSVALVATVAVLLVASLSLDTTAATVPIVVALPTLVVLGMQAMLAARGNVRLDSAGTIEADALRGRERAGLASCLSLLAAVLVLGLLAAIPIYLLLQLRFRSRESWPASIVTASAGLAVLGAGVQWLLGVDLSRIPIVDWWASR